MCDIEINKIYNENCLDTMKKMPDNFIDLTVTSPPYDNLRKYNGYSFDFESIARELFRVTKVGGVVVWIVGDATINGSETGTSFKQALYFKEIGFNLHDTMIYQKKNILPRDPRILRYYQEFEYMFVFSREKPKTCNHIRVDCKHAGKKAVPYSRNNDNSLRLDRKIKNKDHIINKTKIIGNVWKYSVTSNKIHPAPFPEQLANDHIISWSNEGDVVYDPFMGSGTTGKMAKLNNRYCIASEISEAYCEIGAKRMCQEVMNFN